MFAREIMNSNVKVINQEKSLLEAAQLMRDLDCGSIPVESEDKLVGMITDRDITIRGVAEGRDIDKEKVKEYMSSGIKYCFEEDDLNEVMKSMGQNKMRRMPVLNEQKRLVGILSLTDIARHVAKDDTLATTLEQVKH